MWQLAWFQAGWHVGLRDALHGQAAPAPIEADGRVRLLELADEVGGHRGQVPVVE